MDGDDPVTELVREVLGYPLRVQAQRLDEGVHVLLTGGSRSHIGAVSVAEPGKEPETRVFPGHKDQFIAEPWAKALAEKTGERTIVVCGVHYDGVTRAEIAEILNQAERLLRELLMEWQLPCP